MSETRSQCDEAEIRGFSCVSISLNQSGTHVVAGASTGFSTLWLALVTFPMMAAIQFICARIAMVTGRGLAGVLKETLLPLALCPAVLLLVVAKIINPGADIGEIGGGDQQRSDVFIILTTPATLFKAGKTNIQSATNAAEALERLAGAGAKVLLGLGLVGTGFLAVPILTSSSSSHSQKSSAGNMD